MPGTTLLSRVATLSEPWRRTSSSWRSITVTWRVGAIRLLWVRSVTVIGASESTGLAGSAAGAAAPAGAGRPAGRVASAASAASSVKLPPPSARVRRPLPASRRSKPSCTANAPRRPGVERPRVRARSMLRLTPAWPAKFSSAGPSGPAGMS